MRKIHNYLKKHEKISNSDDWYAQQIAITMNYYLDNVGDIGGVDAVLNWILKNVSYDEYLKYKKKNH